MALAILVPAKAFPDSYLLARRHARGGIAAVEFALVGTVLVFMTLGMFELGKGIRAKAVMADAARSGCRAAILPGSSNATVTTNLNSILTDNGLTSGNATVTIKVNGAVVDCNTAQQNDKVSVTVSYPISKVLVSGVLYLSTKNNFSETVTMMRQR